MNIVGGSPFFAKVINSALLMYPAWLVRAARISRVEVSNKPEVRDQIAMYEHGSRKLYIYAGVGALLHKAIGHELAHAIDDNFDNPHFFTSTPEWARIHRNQAYFDIPKYRDEPLEYFADCVTKLCLLGDQKLRTSNPDEVRFITSWVWPTLWQAFGQ